MSQFTPIAKTTEFSDPGKLLVEVEDRLVMLARIGGEYFALDDICTHDGGPLSEGELGEDRSIACPRHGARFDLKTGAALTMPATQATVAHEVKVEGETVFVRLGSRGKSDKTAPESQTPASISAAESTATVSSTPPQSRTSDATAATLSATTTAPSSTASNVPSSAAGPAASTPTSEATSGEVSESRIFESLKQVIDPELFVNIVDLGLIYTVDLKPKDDKFDVSVEMTMTSPACPAGPQLLAQSKDVISRLEKVDGVEIKLVMEPPWTPDRMTEDAKDQLGIF